MKIGVNTFSTYKNGTELGKLAKVLSAPFPLYTSDKYDGLEVSPRAVQCSCLPRHSVTSSTFSYRKTIHSIRVYAIALGCSSYSRHRVFWWSGSRDVVRGFVLFPLGESIGTFRPIRELRNAIGISHERRCLEDARLRL
jgi:hypothetical protein